MNSKKAATILLVTGLIIGAVGGYVGGYLVFQPQVTELQSALQKSVEELSEASSELSKAHCELSDLEDALTETEFELATAKSDVEKLALDLRDAEAEIQEKQLDLERQKLLYAELEEDYASLTKRHVSQVSSLESQISDYKSQLSSYENQVSTLQTRLDRILEIEVNHHYVWVYGSRFWSERYQWDLPIPLSLYCEYYERPRSASWRSWVDMAKDPEDDDYIAEMVHQINSAAISEGFTESEKVNFVIAFVHSLPYTVDSVTTSWDEYPRYPIETLFDRGGDCEDTSILAAALLDRMGYDTALLFLHHEDHVAVGVSIEGVHGFHYLHGDSEYYYLETTGEGWKLGEMPPDFEDTRAYVYPLNP
jgi:uncharacterized membrane-anchored protein YhcB (DUF1043 family)